MMLETERLVLRPWSEDDAEELIRHAFEDLGLEGLWCAYYDGNSKSLRVQEKCGFAHHHTEEDVPCELLDDIRTVHFTHLSKSQWQVQKNVR